MTSSLHPEARLAILQADHMGMITSEERVSQSPCNGEECRTHPPGNSLAVLWLILCFHWHGWDRLRPVWNPLLHCMHFNTPCFEQKLQRNCITTCMCSWDKFWTKDTKRPKNSTATSEQPEQKQDVSSSRVRSMPPAHTAIREVGKSSAPPL